MSAPVSPAPVWDVVNGYAAYQALVAALELGLVDSLAHAGEGGATAEDLAAGVGAVDPGPVALLADLLVSLGLLDADGQRYLLTPVAARFLVSDSPAQMRDLVRLSPGPAQGWAGLADAVRTGRPAVRVDEQPETFLAPLVASTAPTQRAVATAVASHLAAEGLLPTAPVVVDLGAGSAAWAAAFLATRHDATAVAVDLPGMVATTRRLTADLAEQITIVAGDYLEVALPDHADVVVLGHVLRSEPADRARALLHRALAVAGESGTVVVADYPRPEPSEADEPDRAGTLRAARHELTLSLTMLAATPGSGVTVGQVAAWAAEAGAEIAERLEPLPRQHVLLVRRVAASAPVDPASPTAPPTNSRPPEATP